MRAIVGDRLVEGLLRATRGEVLRLAERHGEMPAPASSSRSADAIAGYPVVGKPRLLDEAVFDDLRRALLKSDTYTFHDLPPHTGIAKGCGGFRPGVAVRFFSEVNGKPTRVDVLLCFHCNDAAIFEEGPETSVHPHDVDAGELTLLRLASAALPDDAELADLLTQRLQRRARERLFISMFPAWVQVTMSPEQGPNGLELEPAGHKRNARSKKEVKRIGKTSSSPAFFATASRAFATLSTTWDESDLATDVALAAVNELDTEDVVAGLKLIANDQVALAGAAELYGRHALLRNLAREEQEVWLPTLAEAAVVQSPFASFCPLLAAVGNLPGGKGLSLITRLSKGDLREAVRPWVGFSDRASARACALLTLAGIDATAARAAARAWSPSDPVDKAAKRAALFVTGDEGALDARVLGVESNEVAKSVLDPLRERPTRRGLDLFVRVATTTPTTLGLLRVETLLTDLVGAKLGDTENATHEQRATALREWWASHADAWRPAIPGRNP